jgi:hypothetical protein
MLLDYVITIGPVLDDDLHMLSPCEDGELDERRPWHGGGGTSHVTTRNDASKRVQSHVRCGAVFFPIRIIQGVPLK